MIKQFRNRWARKGNTRRFGEMLVMGLVGMVAVFACEWLGYDDAKTETILAVVAAYVAKLMIPLNEA